MKYAFIAEANFLCCRATAIIRHTMTSTNKRDGMFGLPLDDANALANRVYLWAGLFAIVFTATALAASWIMWRTSTAISEEKDRQLARFQAEASERAAALEKETARANERSAVLEKEAQDARLKTAEIMKSTAWRNLFPEQIAVLTEKLSSMKGKIVLEWPGNDPEAVALAIQFSDILHEAKWDFSFMAQSFPTAVVWGIIVPNSPAPETAAVREALTSAGIPFTTGPLPEANGMSFGNAESAANDTAVLLIGSRRPNLAQAPR